MEKTQAKSGIGMGLPLSSESGIGVEPPPQIGTDIDSAASADTS